MSLSNLLFALLQLGADGGTIPTRDELVKLKAKDEIKSKAMLDRIRWFACSLSKLTLQKPIVADALGNLFNKEAIVSALIEKQMPDDFRHIRSLKDVFDVHFEPNPAFDTTKAVGERDERDVAPWICPISLVEVGHMPFTAMRKCGCVISDRALKEVERAAKADRLLQAKNAASSSNTASNAHALACAHCATPIEDPNTDIVPLNPPEEEYKAKHEALLQAQEIERREKAERKAAAKAAKRALREANGESKEDEKMKPKKKARKAKASDALSASSSSSALFSDKSDVYASIFDDPNAKKGRETFACRAVSGRYC